MRHPLELGRDLVHALGAASRAVVHQVAAAWRHHRDLMEENASYRQQIYLGTTTILTALRVHPTFALLATAVLALYVAAHDDGHWQPQGGGLRRSWGDEQW